MRFAYIDSNGNEVPIPSVDALALRIELGAITEETQLYDAQADQWGPAHTHEIFHSLSRSVGGDEGFVAPPPVAPAPTAPPVAPEPVGEPEAGVAPSDAAPGDGDHAPEEPEEEGEVDAAFGLTLAEVDEADTKASDDVATPVEVPTSGAGAPGTFDFGEMDGGFELEDAFLDLGDDEAVEAPADGVSPIPSEPAAEADPGEGSGFAAGLDLEPAMEFGGAGAGPGGGGLDLEPPMSEFDPTAAPSWTDADGATGGAGQGVMDFSSAGKSGDDDGDDVPLRDRRTPRTKPSAPKLRRQRNLAGPLVGIVMLLAVGIGGYVAWPLVSDRLAVGSDLDGDPIVIPEIPEELMPRMRALADGAFATIYGDVRRSQSGPTLPQAPPRGWLGGAYLANASDFEEVEVFWNGMADLLDGARGTDLATFDAAYAAEAVARGMPVADATIMRERADSGFVAAARDREQTHQRVQALIDSAIRLHRFLVANESSIEFVPASSVTIDPVLEATAPPEILDAMEDLIDAVTRSLSALGYRDLVTADGLWAKVLSDIQEVGIR